MDINGDGLVGTPELMDLCRSTAGPAQTKPTLLPSVQPLAGNCQGFFCCYVSPAHRQLPPIFRMPYSPSNGTCFVFSPSKLTNRPSASRRSCPHALVGLFSTVVVNTRAQERRQRACVPAAIGPNVCSAVFLRASGGIQPRSNRCHQRQ